MTDLRSYFLSVISAALITAIVRRLMGDKGSAAAVCKLMSGLVLTFTVLSPLVNLNLSGMNGFTDAYAYDAQQAVTFGTQISADALEKSIKEKTEAYILDKAKQYDAELSVQVMLTDETIPKPKSVVISGNISPYAKNALQNIIRTDLGVDKEYQIWT